MKTKILAFLMAFLICFLGSSVLLCGSSSKVEAATFNGLEFSTEEFSSNRQNILNTLMALRDNDFIDLDDYYCFISSYSSGSIFLLEKSYTSISLVNGVPDYFCSNGRYFSITFNSTTAVFRNTFVANVNVSDLSSYDFSQVTFNGSYKCDVTLYTITDGIGKIYDAVDSTIGKSYNFWQAANVVNQCTSYGTNEVYIPNSFYTGVHFDYNVDDFYDWIVNNNKLSSLPSYIVQSKLKSFLTFYQSYGASASTFFRFIPEWFSYMNIANQSNDNVNILKSSIDKLYKEYLDYRSSSHAYWPGALKLEERNDIDTVTDNDNLTLVTDTQNDDVYTLILRDILRGIIAIPNQIYVTGQDLINSISHLQLETTLVSNGGVTNLSELYEYDINDFDDDFETFETNVSSITAVPLSYVQSINNNSLMPENMLSDKQNLSVTVPVINGFTVNEDCTEYETNTDTYTFNSTDYPWLDTIVKKMKRFASIMLIIGYLIHLRFKIADIVRGE